MGLFLGSNSLIPASGGGGSVVINGTTVNAPYNALEQVPATHWTATQASGVIFTAPYLGINESMSQAPSHTGTINNDQTTSEEIININGPGALQWFVARRRMNEASGFNFEGAEYTIEVDGVSITYGADTFTTNNERVNSTFIFGGVPTTWNPANTRVGGGNSSSQGVSSAYSGFAPLNYPPLSGATFSNNTVQTNISGLRADTDSATSPQTMRAIFMPVQQWFGAGLPWIRFDTNLTISYTTQNATGTGYDGSYDAQIHTF